MMKRLLVAGGGTGGHLFPGIAVVEELRRRFPELDVLFVGTERGIEARVLPERNELLTRCSHPDTLCPGCGQNKPCFSVKLPANRD